MIKKLIIFLFRKHLGLKKFERFRFANQKKESVYWFTDTCLMKKESGIEYKSTVSLNWLLDDRCELIILED